MYSVTQMAIIFYLQAKKTCSSNSRIGV